MANDIHYTYSTTKRINSFYSTGSSIALTNKYIVGFFGHKVTAAVNILISKNTTINVKELLRAEPFISEDYSGWRVELAWECSRVSIPKGDVTVEKSTHYFDAEKAVKHPFITGVQDTAELTFNITDTKEMIWYQFFNALKNSFFDPFRFRPVGSSFNKLACYVGVIQGTGNKSGSSSDDDTTGQMISQLFEFNSIVPSKFNQIKLSHDSVEPLKLDITFVVPNVFQSTYNVSFAGMRNITGYAVDNVVTTDIKTYYKDNLETDSTAMYASAYSRNKLLEDMTANSVVKSTAE